jgi:hypothetical protein
MGKLGLSMLACAPCPTWFAVPGDDGTERFPAGNATAASRERVSETRNA